jgi:dienelactone hydrolase
MAVHDDNIDIAILGGHLAGTLITPSTRIPGVLMVHGWGGNRKQYLDLAREVAALGCICLTFDLSGHEATEARRESVTREENLADILAAYDVLARQPTVDPSQIAIVGSSYGGYLAAIATTQRPARWLALRAPALYMDNGWRIPKRQLHTDQDLIGYRLQSIAADKNRALAACASFAGDVLLVESQFDNIVPHETLMNYVDAFRRAHSLTYRVIDEADHGLVEQGARDAYISLLVHWLEEMLLGARGRVRKKTSAVRGSDLSEAGLIRK